MSSINEFDLKAADWDENPVNHARSEAIANELIKLLPTGKIMSAMEFGAGTGILSFLLRNSLKEILMIDSSREMVNITNRKIEKTGVKNLKTVLLDLENEDYTGRKFDLIFTQMVLHHVIDIDEIFKKFYKMLNPGGFVAIADLYTEDGSFHGEGFTGHNGFNIEKFSLTLKKCNFDVISSGQCFVINRKISENVTNQYPVFLVIANRL